MKSIMRWIAFAVLLLLCGCAHRRAPPPSWIDSTPSEKPAPRDAAPDSLLR